MFFLDKRVLLLCTFGRLGREKKKARGGRWEGEEIKRGTEAPVLSSSHHPPHAYLFNFFVNLNPSDGLFE